MKEPIIDESVKAYLAACILSGVYVEEDPHELMYGLVVYMNGLEERAYWATGDEDGVILHDKFDNPILSIIYTGQVLQFTAFEQSDYLDSDYPNEVGLMFLNIIGYLREKKLEFEPYAWKNQSIIVPPPSQTNQNNTDSTQDDWSL